MSTIINTPGVDTTESSGITFLVGIVALLVLGGLFVVYIMPQILTSMKPADTNTTIEVKLPTPPAATIE